MILNEWNVYQPDVFFFKSCWTEILGEQWIEAAPNFVVEILSESSAELDRGLKRKTYARSGVSELWLVDPEAKSIQIFEFGLGRSPDQAAHVHSGDAKFTSSMFPGLLFSCEEILRDI